MKNRRKGGKPRRANGSARRKVKKFVTIPRGGIRL